MRVSRLWLFTILLTVNVWAFANATDKAQFMGISASNYDNYRWSELIFYGRMLNNDLMRDLRFKYGGFDVGDLYSVEISYQLAPDNILRRVFNPVTSTIELALNGTYEADPGVPAVYEFNPYLLLRWSKLPWNKVIYTTFGFGEGISYASNIPAHETRYQEKAANAQNFLNYLMFEATFSLPKYQQWQLVYRLHHRSGVFGLYSSGITGSTAAGLGIRYRFDAKQA